MTSSEQSKTRFNQLIRSYVDSLAANLSEIEALQAKARSAGWRGEAVGELRSLIHRLAGSGGAFGFPEITETARTAEAQLGKASTATAALSAEQHDQLLVALSALCEVLKNCAEPGDFEARVPLTITAPPHPVKPADTNLIYILEESPDQSASLAAQLWAYRYTVQTFTELEALERTLATAQPTAVIVDSAAPADMSASIAAIRQLRLQAAANTPILFASMLNNLPARLEALHAGAVAYFTKPFHVSDLIDRLDEMLATPAADPYRVLIVDDDPQMAEFYQVVLENAGMRTRVATDPMTIMAPLVEFQPELLLVDLYMPGCNGLELATALRQEAAYARLPIVFSSLENDPEKRLACLGIGADDYLTKPVSADYLARLIAARVNRNRKVQHVITQDSLTGLLNRNAFMERFEATLGLLARKPGKLAFALIDLDNFKRINERYGHLAGDIALKNTARQLLKRLRRSDIIGRYNGEEFVAVLQNADAATAHARLDEIRAAVGAFPHRIGSEAFYVTFSVGVTGFDHEAQTGSSPPPDTLQWLKAVSEALQQAQQSGGNRVKVTPLALG